MTEKPDLQSDPERPGRLLATGDWRIDAVRGRGFVPATLPDDAVELDATAIERLDSVGALLLVQLADRMDIDPASIVLSESHQPLLHAVIAASGEAEPEPRTEPAWFSFLAHVGEVTVSFGGGFKQFLGFLGLGVSSLLRTMFRPRQWRITSTIHHMEQTGLNALPLVVLLSFLIGAVIAYLGATVLKDFGAELFVVDLTTIAFFREMGVLVTAIILAGRTASAFTAQIGTMKSREEIDAMRTLGLDPFILLVMPRLVALLVMLPILAAAATIAGMAGGMTVSALSLDIGPDLFMSRIHETLNLRHYLVGLIKAPLFAVVIALIGCLEGFKVTGTAQSVGERTTSAVVQSISLVIVINALAAVFFMEMGW
ncbi:ABC transporter permease [Wenzhouxiangella sp. AB-CW3]|uniref:MlaE family ABC transporter permease n=1 Tax=Wenzhouxiangella sp. AB-CW3 TaxID=2771012 RepID=UPI00168B43D3|nr:ABC transporter permease [Wenzhouxiangella sp. AB-CW3]QOC22116.1 ABC transporter permease [Wenzhouxiangella sp. AB-CW3]